MAMTTLQITETVEMGLTRTLDPSEMEPAKEYGKDDLKLIDGKPVYAVRGIVAANQAGYSVSVYLKVRNKPSAPITGSVLRPAPIELVNPTATVFVGQNGRIAYSVIADAIRPVADEKPVK